MKLLCKEIHCIKSMCVSELAGMPGERLVILGSAIMAWEMSELAKEGITLLTVLTYHSLVCFYVEQT